MRPKASADIAEARDKGIYLKMQYDAAKKHKECWDENAKLEEVHSNARLIDETNLDISKVLVLSNVK
jgi:transcription elongation factor GreA